MAFSHALGVAGLHYGLIGSLMSAGRVSGGAGRFWLVLAGSGHYYQWIKGCMPKSWTPAPGLPQPDWCSNNGDGLEDLSCGLWGAKVRSLDWGWVRRGTKMIPGEAIGVITGVS